MAIFIHIGLQKTGTSALHRQLRDNAGLLRTRGVHVPDGALGLDAGPARAHHFLAHALADKRRRYTPKADFERLDHHVAAIRAADAACGGDTLLSSEDFSLLKPSAIARLRALFPGDVRIVVFLRRQDAWIDSLFAHYVKVGRKQDLGAFIDAQSDALDYAGRLGVWADVFGEGQIIVSAYEAQARADIWQAFFRAVGRDDIAGEAVSRTRANESPGRQATDLLAAIDDRRTRNTLRRLLEDLEGGGTREALKYLGAKRARAILRRASDGNMQVAQRFLGQAELFCDLSPLVPAGAKATGSDGLVQARLIAALARRVVQLERRVEDAVRPCADATPANPAASPSA